MPRVDKKFARGRGRQSWKNEMGDRLTTLRAGGLHDQHDTARADMFVDVSPYISLAGIDADRLYSRAGPTMIDQHAIARTRGKHLRGPPMQRQRQHLIAGSHRKRTD